MEILVCVKRVPDTAENEFELNSAGNDLDRDDLVYSVNEWENTFSHSSIIQSFCGNL